jgi:phosphatidylinositol-3,4,5-trisphosphate 3-phosphatase/dual-specificity protein phosphatase PTEN
MPLLAREMQEWLKGSPDRVAVLHCKGAFSPLLGASRDFFFLLAGKGRSGTMACAYLLSFDDNLAPPKLERSYSAKQWAKMRAVDTMKTVPEDADDNLTKFSLVPDAIDEGRPTLESETSLLQAESSAVVSSTSTPVQNRSFRASLKDVLDLHTARRMKAPSASGGEMKQGVSIPSQRRYLYYWALLLARHEMPVHFWTIPSALSPVRTSKVRLTQVVLRMRETPAAKMNLVRAANFVMNRINNRKNEQVWVSLARYDDKLVELLENWEKHTRDEKHMGCRKPGSEGRGDEELDQLFKDGKWDKGKMIRSFARLGAVGDAAVVKSEDNKVGVHI